MPPLSILTTTLFAYLAYRERATSGASLSLYAAAAILAPSIMPYTLLVMMPTNNLLEKRTESSVAAVKGEAEAEVKGGQESTHALVDRWASLNLVRGLISGAAAVLALWASLPGPVEVVAIESFEFVSGANRL
jgi:Domain of unknown function (DUF1772)